MESEPVARFPVSRLTVEVIDWVVVLIVASTSTSGGKSRPLRTARICCRPGRGRWTGPRLCHCWAGSWGWSSSTAVGAQADDRDPSPTPGVGHVEVASARRDRQGNRVVANRDGAGRRRASGDHGRAAGRRVEVVDLVVGAVCDVDVAVGGIDGEGRRQGSRRKSDRRHPGEGAPDAVHRHRAVAVSHVEGGSAHREGRRSVQVSARGNLRRRAAAGCGRLAAGRGGDDSQRAPGVGHEDFFRRRVEGDGIGAGAGRDRAPVPKFVGLLVLPSLSTLTVLLDSLAI